MRIKKIAILFVAIALCMTALSTTAFAASHHGGGNAKAASYSVCPRKNCTKTAIHKHKGKKYKAHYKGDGHRYHKTSVCPRKNCTKTCPHKHNGTRYAPRRDGSDGGQGARHAHLRQYCTRY